MQSALAIISFPPAPVETPPPSAESTDQGFALAFDEGLIAPEGEYSPSDSMAVGLVLPPFWLGAILSIPAVVPSGMEDGVKAGLREPELVAIPDKVAAAPDLSQVVAALGVPDLEAEIRLATPTGAMPTGLDEGASSSLAGKILADPARLPSDLAHQLDPTLDAMPEKAPGGSRPTETQASLLPMQDVIDAVPGGASVASDTTETKTVLARVVDGTRDVEADRIAPLVSESSDRIGTPIEGQVAQREPRPAYLAPIGRDAEPKDHDRHAKIEVDATSGPESAQAPRRSIVNDDVERSFEPALTLPSREPLGSKTQPSSFWEGFFAGLTAPRSLTGLQSDQGAGVAPVVIPSGALVDTAAAVLPVATSASPVGPPTVALPPERPSMAALSDPSAKDFSPLVSVASPPLLERQTASMPVILLSEWNAGPLESSEQLDLALLSGPVLQSGSSFSAASGPQSPLSLPVQQVAAQLAGVLMDVSDKVTELALAPEELGRVSLRLEPDAANPDRMTILINVERPETLDLFRRHAGELADAIKAAGYSGADIGFGQQGQSGNPGHQPKENAIGTGRPPEDQTPVTPVRRDVVGTTLDLRL